MKQFLIIIAFGLIFSEINAQERTPEGLLYQSDFFVHGADTLRERDSFMYFKGNVSLTILGNIARCDTAIILYTGQGIIAPRDTVDFKMLNATLKGNIQIWGKEGVTIYADSLYVDLVK